jgi:malate permease and related proteins
VTVFNLLAPIFLVIGLGAALQKGGLITRDLVGGMTKLLYWVGLPAAVFYAMVEADLRGGGTGPLLLAMAGATIFNAALSWWGAPRWGIANRSRGTFVQASFRGNLSFVALPLLLTVPGIPLGKAMLAFAPMVILHNAATVAVLASSQARSGRNLAVKTLIEIGRNPIILSAAGGLIYGLLGGSLPVSIDRTLGALAQMALPLALLCIGATLVSVPLKGNRGHALLAAGHKVVLSPLIGYAMGRGLGLDDAAMLVLLICLACPTAAISYTMAKQMGGDEGLAASAVVFSALGSMISLSVVIAVFAL